MNTIFAETIMPLILEMHNRLSVLEFRVNELEEENKKLKKKIKVIKKVL